MSAPSPTPTPLGWWAHCRAALVAAHLVAILLLALPSPDGALYRAHWAEPTVQDELRSWSGVLNDWGAEVTPEELEGSLWRAANAWSEARARLLVLPELYAHYCGTDQDWQMFVAPHRYPTRLHLDIREGGAWRPIYVEPGTEHRWRAATLNNYRFRVMIFVMAWDGYEEEYALFTRWAARQAARDFPHADAVRARFWKGRTPSAAEARAGAPVEGAFVKELVIQRGAAR